MITYLREKESEHMKIKDLKVGDKFVNTCGQDCIVTESHLQMGETPYCVIDGADAGKCGYYEDGERELDVVLLNKR